MSLVKETRNCVVVLGMEEQGLALLQCMYKTHEHVHFFVDRRRPRHAWENSRFGEKHCFSDLIDLENQLTILQYNYEEKLCIFISSANLLTDIRINSPQLYDKYSVSSSPLKWINILTTKHLMYEYAINQGLVTARFRKLSDYKNGDLTFPLILKRDIEYVLSFKTKKVDSQDEFNEFVAKVPDNHDRIIVQEMIPDGAKDLSLHAYLHKGEIMGCVSFEEVRHYPKGISSYMKEVNEEISSQLKSEAQKLFSNTDYSGFVQIDFKYLDGIPIIMDVNTRTPGSHSAFHCKFSNWREFYSSIPDAPIKLIAKDKKVCWINVVRDFVGNKADGKLSETFKGMIGSHWDVFDWQDPCPFFQTFALIIKQRKSGF